MANQDWTGGKASVFKTIGASNHADHERESNDYYATEPLATELLCELEQFNTDIWEPACGEGHMARVLMEKGYNVKATDIVDRGFGNIEDFLSENVTSWNGDIITNPPYKFARQFVEKALSIVQDGAKVAMFLKLTFLEGKARKPMFLSAPPMWFGCLQAA